MHSRPRWFWILIIPVLVSILGVTTSFAQGEQSDDNKYFTETGHWVSGDFLRAYQSAADPKILYGFPITDEFTSSAAGGRRVQYFEYARFEYRPDNPPELRVVKTQLGSLLYNQDSSDQVESPPQGATGCRTFRETGFQVCYAFLNFFDKYGGIDQFGYPISDLLQSDSMLVQYFQLARMEWHPGLPEGKQVVLTDVGRRYFTLFEDPRRAQPIITNGAPHVILSVQAHAFVSQPVIKANDEQTVFVVVQDQSLAPVMNAVVTVLVKQLDDPTGKVSTFPVNTTDEKGIARITFPVQQQTQGLVEITVLVDYNGLTQKTITSYRVWW